MRKKLLTLELIRPLYNNFDGNVLEKNNLYITNDYSKYNLYKEYEYDYYERDVIELQELFQNIKISKFKLFFKTLNIDTPHILNKTTSLKRNQNSSDFSNLAICLSRHGKYTSASNIISWSIFKIFSEFQKTFKPLGRIFTMYNIYYYSTIITKSTNTLPSILSTITNANLNFENFLEDDQLIKVDEITPNNLFHTSIKKFNLLFSFYIYKVDKNIYKNSRGKSGKYTFV